MDKFYDGCTKECRQVEDGWIDIINYGGFFVRFWGSYDLILQTFDYDSGSFAIGGERKVIIPKNATNIKLNVDIGLIPGALVTAFTKQFQNSDQRCFVAYGVTFLPFLSEVPCTAPGVIKDVFPEGVFIPNKCFDCCYCNPCLCNKCCCKCCCKGCPDSNCCCNNNSCYRNKDNCSCSIWEDICKVNKCKNYDNC
ncbi:hypothetical protein C3495_08810 [Clostridiaceae bacterium 14S0207]|nr:hypothetical protein C3495_08810 [Clostridiaceae bacterium 14S0207]